MKGMDFDLAAVRRRVASGLLEAIAAPGLPVPIDAGVPAVSPLDPPLCAVLLALADSRTPVWLQPSVSARVAEWIRARCGAPLVEDPRHASFLVICDPATMPPLSMLDDGTEIDPEASATLLVQLDSLTGGAPVVLRGPGIETERIFAPRGIGRGFWSTWSANAKRYPLGIDAYLFDATSVAGLPRTVQTNS